MTEDKTTITRLHANTQHETGSTATESSDFQLRLRRDAFLQLCLQYKTQPNLDEPLCHSCLTAHLKTLFFPRQLLESNETRSCKIEGVLAVCPCMTFAANYLRTLSPWGRPSETINRVTHKCGLGDKVSHNFTYLAPMGLSTHRC